MRNKVLRILGTALVLSLLIGLIPVVPALAATGTITAVSPSQGPQGQTVTVTGTGYTASSTPYILWQGTQITSTGSVNASGYLTAYFTVPASIPRALYTITVGTSAGDTSSNTATFLVTPVISLSASSGSVGDQITVYGTGYTASSYVTVHFDSVARLTTTSTTYGSISGTLTIPSCVRGSHTITVIGPSSESATTTFATVSKLTVSPTLAAAGDVMTISGSGFGTSQTVAIYFDDVATGTTTISDTLGSFSIATYVFPTTYAGTHTIRAQDASTSVSATVTTKQLLSINPDTGPVNTQVTVTGTGFKANSSVSVTLDNVAVSSLSVVSDAKGSLSGTFNIPPIAAGAHQIKVTDGTTTDTKTFTVTATATLSPSSGIVGAKITVNGSGFLANQGISILFDNASMKTLTSDSQGGFGTNFEAPSRPAGTYKIRATDGANFIDMNFTITTSASITQTSSTAPAYVGAQITVGGVGFTAGATVRIAIDGKDVATGAVGTDSNFSLQFSAPALKSGQHTVTVSDGTTTLPLTLYMEATPPPAPALILPEAGIKTKSTPTLTWNPVSDASGVTYTLQISSDTNFSTLIMEKTGLTTSQYTVTKDEKLKPVNRDNAYYWRVKATDGAFNEGGWSNARSFMVGSAFPTWALWTLIGLGAVIILLFVFWLGRRAAVTRPPSTRLEDN